METEYLLTWLGWVVGRRGPLLRQLFLFCQQILPREDGELAAAVDGHREESLHDILPGKSDSVQKRGKAKGEANSRSPLQDFAGAAE
ncbi:hypothetical protein SAY87_010072 [Trapa incisa]|uniref:Uncharacterized protein n=1 Tax=Trapa incisa TaxID=236973 RepID=A0AAN7GIZ1_9MYRT|nr:hypothetical protein SAY87_010072 [Trapa incisa]